MVFGLMGTAMCLGVNPEMVPSPTPAPFPNANAANMSYHHAGYDGLISVESIGVSTWIASVLFCSSVCFGNIGRRVAVGHRKKRESTF